MRVVVRDSAKRMRRFLITRLPGSTPSREKEKSTIWIFRSEASRRDFEVGDPMRWVTGGIRHAYLERRKAKRDMHQMREALRREMKHLRSLGKV